MISAINPLILLFGVSALYLALTSRIEDIIKTLAFQGAILFLILLCNPGEMNKFDLGILFLETLGFKTLLIPIFLLWITHQNEIYREMEPTISNFHSLIMVTLILAFGFFLSYWSMDIAKSIKPLHFGISISTILVGLFLFLTRKKIMTHVLSFLIIENGIFLLSLSMASRMPRIIEVGIFLDLFMVVFLLGLFINRIQSTYDEIDIDSLTELKD